MVGVYIPEGFGSNLRPKLALAQAGSAKMKYAFLGHSWTASNYATLLSKGYAPLFGQAVRGANGSASDGGSGFQSVSQTKAWYDQITGNTIVSAFYASELITHTGGCTFDSITGGTAYNADGPGGLQMKMTVGATATATVRGTTAYVCFLNVSTAQTATVSIDGAAAVTVNIPATTGVTTYTVSGLATGTHTVLVTITSIGGGAGVYLCGFGGENAAGVVVDTYAVPGGSAWQFDNVVGIQNTQIGNGITVTPASSGTFAPAGKWSGGSQRPCDVLFYCMDLNDLNGNRSDLLVAREADMMVREAKEASPNMEMVFLSHHFGNFDVSPNNRRGAEYAARMRGLAESFGGAHVNIHLRGKNSWQNWKNLNFWSGGKTAPGTVHTNQADDSHPIDAGMLEIYNAILPVGTGVVASNPGRVIY